MRADSVWTKRECRSSDRVDKPGATRRWRVAPTLPTLIHPLPTLRRTTAGVGWGRLRRNNNRLFSIAGRRLSATTTPPRLGQRQTAAMNLGTIA